MARQIRIEFPGAFYHVTSRGNERKAVFKSKRDRHKFLEYLESATNRYGAIIHAYCLMNNHYHLLIETPLGNLSQIMQHINGAYTTYFNVKRGRSGHLFQGRYKSILVEEDEYAKELSRYIHLNPVRAKAVKTLEEYQWSSYQFYAENKDTPEWLFREFILGYFGKRISTCQRKYKDFVHSMIDQNYKSPLSGVTFSVILGSKDYVLEIKDKYLKKKKQNRDLSALRELSDRIDVGQISDEVDTVLRADKKLARQVKIYFCHRYSGKKLKEIGDCFNIGESAVSQTSRRLSDRMKKDRKLRKKIGIVKKKLGL